jgi:hypothetical protein
VTKTGQHAWRLPGFLVPAVVYCHSASSQLMPSSKVALSGMLRKSCGAVCGNCVQGQLEFKGTFANSMIIIPAATLNGVTLITFDPFCLGDDYATPAGCRLLAA